MRIMLHPACRQLSRWTGMYENSFVMPVQLWRLQRQYPEMVRFHSFTATEVVAVVSDEPRTDNLREIIISIIQDTNAMLERVDAAGSSESHAHGLIRKYILNERELPAWGERLMGTWGITCIPPENEAALRAKLAYPVETCKGHELMMKDPRARARFVKAVKMRKGH